MSVVSVFTLPAMSSAQTKKIDGTLNKNQVNHAVKLVAGKKCQITMKAKFDTYLTLKHGNATVAFNDDFDGTLNSQINFTPKVSGTYTIVASSYRNGGVGNYTIEVIGGELASQKVSKKNKSALAQMTRTSAPKHVKPKTKEGHPSLAQPYLYELKEFTRDERVAVGSDGNVLRWGKSGKGDQKFVFIPASNGGWNIVSGAPDKINEYVTVDGVGNIRLYGFNGQKNQLFRIQFVSGNQIRLKESTKSQRVAVGSNGNILRYASTEGNDQKFELIPHLIQGKKPTIRPREYAPFQIPLPPQPDIKAKVLPPVRFPQEKGKAFLVAEEVVSAALINDPNYGPKNRYSQMINNPWYKITREQYWDAEVFGKIKRMSGIEGTEVEVRTHHGMREEHLQKATKTFNANAKGEASAKIEVGPAEVESSRSVTLDFTYEKINSLSKVKESFKTHTEKRVSRKGNPYYLCIYRLVDRVTVYDKNNRPVSTWEVAHEPFIEFGSE